MSNFLVEIQTEELPPKALLKLAESFREGIKKGLADAQLTFSDVEFFATPRRLAVKVNQLIEKQADNIVERRGPAFSAAFDDQGKPTQACIGFAKSCGVSVDDLMTLENPQGKWVGYKQKVGGKTAQELLPTIVQNALNTLPIPKRMRWGNNSVEFVRPVHSVILLYGSKVIDAEILGCRSGNITAGHRFLCKKPLKISNADDYADILEKKGFVMADFFARKKEIIAQAKAITPDELNNELLDEVTSLVEWPVAILGKFDAEFLRIPEEVLISSMQTHQRYFPIRDKNKLAPAFIAISNLKSRDMKQVISGNERVLRARLSDAAFFFDVDKKTQLIDRVEKLATIVYQAKLGSLKDRANRLKTLMGFIAKKLNINTALAERAGLLAKTDLTTELVGEFPDLQGIAGYYYALNDGEDKAVAIAIKEHYQPRFAGESLPDSELGLLLALAERLDTLVGIFGINLIPTGEKDPFGLRRATLGVLRILIEKKLNLDILELLERAAEGYGSVLANKNVIQEVWYFMIDRLKPWYQDQAVSSDILASVLALNITKPYDIHSRIQAVKSFKKLPQSESLSVANKRVSNILSQYEGVIQLKTIDNNLFEHEAERELAKKLDEQAQKAAVLAKAEKYQEVLTLLAELRDPVDQFFDHVLVMAEDQKLRENRLLLLKKLRELFLQVADIALLQQ